jgi:hypothetical protein
MLTYVANFTTFNLNLTPKPTSEPTSLPTGQPSTQPSSRPTAPPSKAFSKPPSSQPTSVPSVFVPVVALGKAVLIGDLTTQSTIIVFSCVGLAVLLIFIFFTCYCQHKYHKDEKDKILSLVEEEFGENDKNQLIDQEMGGMLPDESAYYRTFREDENPLHTARGSHLDSDRSNRDLTRQFSTVNKDRESFTDRSNRGLSRVDSTVSGRGLERGLSRMDSTASGLGGKKGNADKRSRTLIRRSSRGSMRSISNISMGSMMGSDMPNTARSVNTSRSRDGETPLRKTISQVTVKSFNGKGGAPRLTVLRNGANGDDAARARFIEIHEDDVLHMMNFFKRAGLSMKKANACAEEAICLDASSPRKLFKYVHEVAGFSLIHLGMDDIDAEMVLEVLNGEFAASLISPAAAAKQAADQLMRSRGNGSYKNMSAEIDNSDEEKESLMDSQYDSNARPDLRSFLSNTKKGTEEDIRKRGSAANLKHLKENENDVSGMYLLYLSIFGWFKLFKLRILLICYNFIFAILHGY